MEIKKVVVIGSGTMGSGIAAHLCNANVPVTLLDLTTDISTKARERIHKSRPPLLIDKSKINNLVGNIKKIFNEYDNNLSIGILENGISVRFLGDSTQDARKCFFCIWKQIRSVSGFCEPKYQGVWPLQDSMNY